jgi:hypothetical protein
VTTAYHVRLGVKFETRCPICKRMTGSRDYEKEKTSLYEYSAQDANEKTVKKFVGVHPECAGGSTKNAVGGEVKYRSQPKNEIEIEVPK